MRYKYYNNAYFILFDLHLGRNDLHLGRNISHLLSNFKNILQESRKTGGRTNEDLVKMISEMNVDNGPQMDVSKLDRKSSVLIATAKVMTKSDIDISNLKLDLPRFVQNDLEGTLDSYLNALQLDGYQKNKKRKAFVIGNTGKFVTAYS